MFNAPDSITSSAVTTPTSMLERRRPVPSTASSTTRKPVSSRSASNPSTPSSTTKALPLSPPQVSPPDHISSLQAQLDDLRVRRANLQRVLRDLQTRHMGPGWSNPLVSDLAVRRRMEERVRALEDEIAEVARGEHDVGLRLHRAWRKKGEVGELGATMWVRRVTR